MGSAWWVKGTQTTLLGVNRVQSEIWLDFLTVLGLAVPESLEAFSGYTQSKVDTPSLSAKSQQKLSGKQMGEGLQTKGKRDAKYSVLGMWLEALRSLRQGWGWEGGSRCFWSFPSLPRNQGRVKNPELKPSFLRA